MSSVTRCRMKGTTLTCLEFENVAFTRVEAQFVHDLIRHIEDTLIYSWIQFYHCTFHPSDGCVDILKDCVENYSSGRRRNDMLDTDIHFNNKGAIQATWFPSLTAFASQLHLRRCSLDDADFKLIVDTILGSSAKQSLRCLVVCENRISSKGLGVDATRLVEHCSQLVSLIMSCNRGMLDDLEQVQALCHKLKKNRYLTFIRFDRCGASEHTVRAVTTMFVDVLQVNKTLTALDLRQNTSHRRLLEPWLRRNARLATVLPGVQELVQHPNNNNTNTIYNPDVLLMRILREAMEDFELEKSATFLLIRHAILGGGGRQDDNEPASRRPLHEAIVDFLQSSTDEASASSLPAYAAAASVSTRESLPVASQQDAARRNVVVQGDARQRKMKAGDDVDGAPDGKEQRMDDDVTYATAADLTLVEQRLLSRIERLEQELKSVNAGNVVSLNAGQKKSHAEHGAELARLQEELNAFKHRIDLLEDRQLRSDANHARELLRLQQELEAVKRPNLVVEGTLEKVR
jgi:hypothetical protein